MVSILTKNNARKTSTISIHPFAKNAYKFTTKTHYDPSLC
jgi:hypothetical protein